MATDDEQITSTEQPSSHTADIPLPYWQKEGDPLPDNPLLMPPPYWRNSGATFHIVDTLESLIKMLHALIPLVETREIKVQEYFDKYSPQDNSPEALEEFGAIIEPPQDLEQRIQLKVDLAILMAAIAVEDSVNAFCVYNLHKDIAESIERLSVSDKFLVACTIVGKSETRSTPVYDGLKDLNRWRNKYAHGHCVDRPTESLRANHLISPKSEPNVWTSFNSLFDHCNAYLNVEKYLRESSINPFTAEEYPITIEIRTLLDELSRFTFLMPDDSGEVYSLNYETDEVTKDNA